MNERRAAPHNSLVRKLVTRGFQRYWRLSRSHMLRAEALIWGSDHKLWVTSDGRLPGAHVKRGQSAEEALLQALASPVGAPSLLAIVPGLEAARSSIQIALFEFEAGDTPMTEGIGEFVAPEALAAALSPEILTIVQRRASLRRTSEPA